MFSFFNKSNDDVVVPEWASFFDGRKYRLFLKAVDNYFKENKYPYQLEDGYLTSSAKELGSHNLGLTNVAQVCSQSITWRYNRIVAEHFDAMVRAIKFDEAFHEVVHDFEKVKKFIAVRLYSNEYVEQIGKELTIGKDVAGDVVAMLVFDLPDSIINIQPVQAEKWGRHLEELFEVGLQNVKKNYKLNISQKKIKEIKFWFVHGDHFFTPNMIFDLTNYPQCIGSFGALVGIPHRHMVIIYPIENRSTIQAVNDLILMTHRFYAEGPGSLSNNLFWYHQGHFENQPCTMKEDKIQFFPTEHFKKMILEMTN